MFLKISRMMYFNTLNSNMTTVKRYKKPFSGPRWAPFALLSAGMSAGIRDVTRYDKTFGASFDSDAARWDWS